MMYEPCYCGAIDCPECSPGCLEPAACRACGETYPDYLVSSEGICENCRDEGYGECATCGEVEILVDGALCGECWAEELEEACKC